MVASRQHSRDHSVIFYAFEVQTWPEHLSMGFDNPLKYNKYRKLLSVKNVFPLPSMYNI